MTDNFPGMRARRRLWSTPCDWWTLYLIGSLQACIVYWGFLGDWLSGFTLWFPQCWQLIVNTVAVLTSPRYLSRRAKKLSVCCRFWKTCIHRLHSKKKPMKTTMCWKMCGGKLISSSLHRVNKTQEYQIKPENKGSYLCLVWVWKNCAVTGTCMVANRWKQQ